MKVARGEKPAALVDAPPGALVFSSYGMRPQLGLRAVRGSEDFLVSLAEDDDHRFWATGTSHQAGNACWILSDVHLVPEHASLQFGVGGAGGELVFNADGRLALVVYDQRMDKYVCDVEKGEMVPFTSFRHHGAFRSWKIVEPALGGGEPSVVCSFTLQSK